jgi:hypothetical protein
VRIVIVDSMMVVGERRDVSWRGGYHRCPLGLNGVYQARGPFYADGLCIRGIDTGSVTGYGGLGLRLPGVIRLSRPRLRTLDSVDTTSGLVVRRRSACMTCASRRCSLPLTLAVEA